MPVKIREIQFNAGSAPGATPLTIRPDAAVVLVGPNNSGKSTALREIEEWCWNPGATFKVIRTMDVSVPETEAELMELLRPFQRRPPIGQVPLDDGLYLGHFTFRGATSRHFGQPLAPLREAITRGEKATLWDVILKLVTIRLDGRTRFSLVEQRESGDLRAQPNNHLWQLFGDDPARARVREATRDAFDVDFVIDATSMKTFQVRMSKVPPTGGVERALSDRTIEFMDAARPIAEFGDGVQAFSGLLAAIYSLPHRILLVDEPEAFLHPPLARRLGADLARSGGEATLVAATHSADFLIPDPPIARPDSAVGTRKQVPF